MSLDLGQFAFTHFLIVPEHFINSLSFNIRPTPPHRTAGRKGTRNVVSEAIALYWPIAIAL